MSEAVWEQSSHPSLSVSEHTEGSNESKSTPSKTVSLSSSSSPTLQAPSESVSKPSLSTWGLTSFASKLSEAVWEQSSQPSPSKSEHTEGSNESKSSPSRTVSLSSSSSPTLQAPSESVSKPSSLVSGPTFPPSGPDIVWEQSSHPSPSESKHCDDSNGSESSPSATVSLSSSASHASPSESLSLLAWSVFAVSGQLSASPFTAPALHTVSSSGSLALCPSENTQSEQSSIYAFPPKTPLQSLTASAVPKSQCAVKFWNVGNVSHVTVDIVTPLSSSDEIRLPG